MEELYARNLQLQADLGRLQTLANEQRTAIAALASLIREVRQALDQTDFESREPATRDEQSEPA